MASPANLSDISWSILESTFSEQSKTPASQHMRVRTPGAPRKPTRKKNLRRAGGLKPRKLTYDFESYQRQKDEEENMISNPGLFTPVPAQEQSFFDAEFRRIGDDDEDENKVDKENQPETVDIVPGTPPNEIQPDSLRNRLGKWLERNFKYLNINI